MSNKSAFIRFAIIAAVGLSIPMAGSNAQDASVEEELHIHRLKSGETSPYDAFLYANRVGSGPNEGQSAVDFAGMVIFSRLSNIEGRVQLKIVDGFQRPAYLGYKTFLRAWPEIEGVAVGNCVVCHTPSHFTDSASHFVDNSGEAKETPALRNLKKTNAELESILREKLKMAEKARAGEVEIDEAYQLITLEEEDIKNLVAFLQSLNEVPEEEFRQLIVNAEILDTSDLIGEG